MGANHHRAVCNHMLLLCLKYRPARPSGSDQEDYDRREQSGPKVQGAICDRSLTGSERHQRRPEIAVKSLRRSDILLDNLIRVLHLFQTWCFLSRFGLMAPQAEI
jgi:hypothetical protein